MPLHTQARHSRKKAQVAFVPKERRGPKSNEPVPTAIFHGVRQKCNEEKLILLEEEVRKGTGGYAQCIEIGNGEVSSIFSPMVLQVDEACKKIQEHPVFGNQEFNVVGLSQGALIGRYIVESCDTKHNVRNLITVGGPNNGFDF